MVESSRAPRYLVPACLLSLALYVALSHGLRVLLGSWTYHRLLVGMVWPNINQNLKNLWGAIAARPAGGSFEILLVGMFPLLWITAAELTRRLIGRHLEVFPAVVLFSFAYAVVPQTVLALVLWPDGRGLITRVNYTAILLCCIAVQAAWLIFRRKTPFIQQPEHSRQPIGLWGYAFLVGTILLLSTTLIIALSGIQGTDAISYHLPLVVRYWQSAGIGTGVGLQFFYPSNAELAIRWFLTVGNDHLANILPFLAAVLTLSVLYRLALAIGQGRQAAMVSACCAATVPFIPQLATVVYSDLFGALFILLSLLYFYRWWETGGRNREYVFCSGLAIGLAIGCKYSMLPAAALISLFFAISTLRTDRAIVFSPETGGVPVFNRKWISKNLSLLVAAILPGALYWYLRNLAIHGNPIYPVALLNLPGFPLEYIISRNQHLELNPWAIVHYPWTEFDYFIPFDCGLGAVFAAIVIPVALWWPFHMKRHWKPEAGRNRFARCILYCFAVVIILHFISQKSTVTRFGAVGILSAFLLVGEGWQLISSRYFRITVCAAYLLMLVALEQGMLGGIFYRMAIGFRTGAARFDLPTKVDRMPPAVIFNAAYPHQTYGLDGWDYRHDVIKLFASATVEDVRKSSATYLFLKTEDAPKFRAGLKLDPVATSKSPFGEAYSLYRIAR